jgi:hypothetical protein
MTDISSPTAPATGKNYAAARPKVPPFARYKGTSAWRKNPRRVRAYAAFLAETAKKPGTKQT